MQSLKASLGHLRRKERGKVHLQIHTFLLFILYEPKGYSVIVFNDAETSVDPPFYQHQTFCVIYSKTFGFIKYG